MKTYALLGLSICAIVILFINGIRHESVFTQAAAMKMHSWGEGWNESKTNGADQVGGNVFTTGRTPFVTNNSPFTVYYKPEDKTLNPDLDPDGAYPIAPGGVLYFPVDGLVTAATQPGKIYRVPTGSSVIIDEYGDPKPGNMIAMGGIFLHAYGNVEPPDPNFAKLANTKMVLYRQADIRRKTM